MVSWPAMDIAFTAKVQAIGRIAIPLEIREALDIAQGDMITVRIEKVISRKRAK